MPSYHYEGPEPVSLDGGLWGCPVEGCNKGPDGSRQVSDTALGIKQHVTRSHKEVMPHAPVGRPKGSRGRDNGHAPEEMFKTMAKVTQALVADAPSELYERMEEIVEVRKMVARYLGKRYM